MAIQTAVLMVNRPKARIGSRPIAPSTKLLRTSGNANVRIQTRNKSAPA